ncbi:hypothetical protein [Gottschalkia acidurici]|nr:hypothetical protein [Gottschalkia acidurici]
MTVNITPSLSEAIGFLIPLILYLILMGLGIYTMILIIKALKIYIKKNS